MLKKHHFLKFSDLYEGREFSDLFHILANLQNNPFITGIAGINLRENENDWFCLGQEACANVNLMQYIFTKHLYQHFASVCGKNS